tara:strand:- start:429 stop:701 length:273 start_codon:yes stop_codon:yes gene_type:complete
MSLLKMTKLQNESNQLQDKSNDLQNSINDVHYAFTKQIADTVVAQGKNNIELHEKVNILIEELQKLSSRVIKLEFEDEHEKKSIGGTTNE